MKKTSKFICLMLALALICGCLAGCGKEPVAPATSDTPDVTESQTPAVPTVRVNLGTATSGSLFYSAGIAATQLWVEKFGINASATASSGSKENLQMLKNGELNMGFLQSDVLINSYNGLAEFEGDAYEDLRILAPVTTNPYHLLVRSGSGIEKITDVVGKNVVVGSAGGGTYNQHRAVLGAFGITFDDINESNIGQAESIEAMRNGLCDFTIAVGMYPFGVVVDALTSDNIGLLSLTQDDVDKILAANDWQSAVTIPAGTYEGQDEDYLTIAHNGYICVSADFPEEDAYLLTKCLYENTDWLINAFNSFDSWALHNPVAAAEATGVPFHPGAQRALEELGCK